MDMNRWTLLLWAWGAVALPACARAQAAGESAETGPTAAPATHADPLDAKASVPALHYRSSLSRYRSFSDDKPLSWREANDAVGRIGGWRTYAREARQPEAAPAGAALNALAVRPLGRAAVLSREPQARARAPSRAQPPARADEDEADDRDEGHEVETDESSS